MIILAIETSCDDTSVAIIKVNSEKGRVKKENPEIEILVNLISSQINIHKKWGGVVPNLASRAHAKNLPIVFKRALKEARLNDKVGQAKIHPHTLKKSSQKIINKKTLKGVGVKMENIDAIAVTIGPGLAPSLLIGVHFARALAYKYNKPIIPVNHVEGHICSNFCKKFEQIKSSSYKLTAISFPIMNLIVSGGHTSLYLMKGRGLSANWRSKYELIGKTRDDAGGEAFDKAAKMLGLGYPGGPAIAALAAQVKSEKRKVKSEIKFPRPMIKSGDFDFSFSGLKTAVFYKLREISSHPSFAKATAGKQKIGRKIKIAIAYEFQQAVIDVLISKTISAAKRYGAKTIAISGGVSANTELRKQIEIETKKNNLEILLPPKNMSTDNALMIAIAGYYNRDKKTTWDKIDADPNLKL